MCETWTCVTILEGKDAPRPAGAAGAIGAGEPTCTFAHGLSLSLVQSMLVWAFGLSRRFLWGGGGGGARRPPPPVDPEPR